MASRFSLDGKVAFVTGASGGIGAGIAAVLAEAGALVVIADIDSEGAERQAEQLIAIGHRADWIRMDVSQEDSVRDALTEVSQQHGTPWVVVNNAGIQDRQYIADETVEAWDRIQAVNVRGAFLVSREFGRAMINARQGGRIINIASGVLSGMIVKGAGSYAASKGALAAFSSVSALEFADHGITVNTILPGAVKTPGTLGAKGPPPVGPGTRRAVFGLCDPQDIGFAVLFLASSEARMVTNQVLAVDGGFSLA